MHVHDLIVTLTQHKSPVVALPFRVRFVADTDPPLQPWDTRLKNFCQRFCNGFVRLQRRSHAGACSAESAPYGPLFRFFFPLRIGERGGGSIFVIFGSVGGKSNQCNLPLRAPPYPK